MRYFIKRPYFWLFLCVFLCFFTVFNVAAQETFDFTIMEPARAPLANPNPAPPPRIFRELYLGMTLDELKAALADDPLFQYRGDRDVSFLPLREETLVETTGVSFIRRAFFQLIDGRVYIMTFTMDTRLIDHYSIFTSFLGKYGEPGSLSPAETVWEDDETRVAIERPLTVKYIDKAIFNELIEQSNIRESREIFLRQEFINEF